MGKTRMEAFSDGVLAIILTIMVLEMKVPHSNNVTALKPLLPVFLSYILSFINIGIYWNNHHHLLHIVQHVNGKILWLNNHLLFWLSLIPFASGWMGENHFTTWPVVIYGIVLMMAAVAYYMLEKGLAKHNNAKLAKALGNDTKGKLSLGIYAIAIAFSFLHSYIGFGLYVVVAMMWLIPDKRIEKEIKEEKL